MSVLYRCDGLSCEKIIGPNDTYFEVDIANRTIDVPHPSVDGDDAEWSTTVTIPTLGNAAEFHFCSALCLTTWASERAFA